MSAAERHLAVVRAHKAGWLLYEPRIYDVENFRGVSLNDAGIVKVAELTRPWWRPIVSIIAHDARTVVLSVASAVATVVVLSLLD
jgi:hypothetical protein